MKPRTIFLCSKCDAQYQKWVGRCLECGSWGTIAETAKKIELETVQRSSAPAELHTLASITSESTTRHSTTIPELDRVLGGGLVPGSFTLLGGEPGIGKSTLALQIAASLPNSLYISGEESVGQVKMRATRLGVTSTTLSLANETAAESIIHTITLQKPSIAIIDSIQTMYSEQVQGEVGSLSQVRACTTLLLEAAKKSSVPIILIGHVTKEGSVAGPKTLEHLVDTVLYLEGERFHTYRILRATKNRFGATDEVGIFEMEGEGLISVANPSASLLRERGEDMPGNVVTCIMEGTRPLLVEVQALVHKTSFGYPVRKASGFDLNRLHVLVAVLEKRAGLSLAQYDIHLNIVGGIKIQEPAADLAICLAIASSYKDKALGKDTAVFGEVGLGGEVRSVRYQEKRIKESHDLGMKRIIVAYNKKSSATKDAQVIAVKNIEELIKKT
jgi:DNA repair protein RadA/Sms